MGRAADITPRPVEADKLAWAQTELGKQGYPADQLDAISLIFADEIAIAPQGESEPREFCLLLARGRYHAARRRTRG